MLQRFQTLRSYTIKARDGEIGSIVDFYFDSAEWIVRYFVIDTGSWLPGRKVLLSPSVFRLQEDLFAMEFHTELTKAQIKGSPSWDSQKPVSRQREEELSRYYGWQPYWAPGYSAGPPIAAAPYLDPEGGRMTGKDARGSGEGKNDPNLRNAREVTGYHIESLDGEVGHVEDFIMDTDNSMIRYILVDTRNWLPGKKVILSPHWIQQVSWDESKVYAALETEKIKNSPEYDPSEHVGRNYEEKLHRYYGWKGYWEKGEPVKKSA